MLKRLLFTMVLAFSFSLVMNAQTGTLDNLSFDANVAPGQTGLTFSCDYTASAAGTYEWQLIKALPDGSPDWAAGSTVYSTGAITMATTATPLTINYDVPASADTGTYTWADPKSEIVYVFLSNRVYPHMNNTGLIKTNMRTKIQQVIQDAIID